MFFECNKLDRIMNFKYYKDSIKFPLPLTAFFCEEGDKYIDIF